MKKIIVVLTITIILCIGMICIISSKYCLIAGELYDLNSTEISVDCKNKAGISLKSLNKLKYCKRIRISNSIPSNYTDLSQLSIEELSIACSSFSDTDIFGKFDCENTDCFLCKIDFNGIYDNKIRKLYLLYCDIYNLENLNHYESLEELDILGVYINSETRSFNTNNSFPVINDNGKLILENTDIFSELDNIKNLRISQMTIQDINGILDMDNLKEIHLDKDTISEEQKIALQNKNIQVFEE